MKVLVIRLGLSPKTHPNTVGDFRFSPEHGVYVLDGEALRPVAFNEIAMSKRWKRIMEDHGPFITVQLVGLRDMAKARAKSPNGRPGRKKAETE